MNSLTKLYAYFNKPRLLWICFGLWLTVNVLLTFIPNGTLALYHMANETWVPDLLFYYALNDLQVYFENLGPEGIEAFQSFRIYDTIYPVTYAMLLFVVAIRTNSMILFKAAPLLAFVAMFFDYMENTFLQRCAELYPVHLDAGIVSMASTMTNLKWVAIMAALFTILYGAMMKKRTKTEDEEEQL